MDAVTKVAKQRLSVLQLAEKLGNAAEACRKRGMDRTSFYEWKRRFQTEGFEGLKDLPPIHRSHPQTTAPEVVERIKALALEHPAYGCNRIEAMLALEGRRVSAITVQKILNDHDLGSRHDRWLAASTWPSLSPRYRAIWPHTTVIRHLQAADSGASGPGAKAPPVPGFFV